MKIIIHFQASDFISKFYLDLEIPKINIGLIHEKGEETSLNFMGFKIKTNLTVKPIIDIFKNLCKIDKTEIKSWKIKSQFNPPKIIKRNEQIKKETRVDNKQKDSLNRNLKFNQKINKIIVDDSIINTTPTMNMNQPSSKKQDTDSECDFSTQTPKYDQTFVPIIKSSKEINKNKNNKPPLKDDKTQFKSNINQNNSNQFHNKERLSEKPPFGFGMKYNKLLRPCNDMQKASIGLLPSANSTSDIRVQLKNDEEIITQSNNSNSNYVRSYRQQTFTNNSKHS